MFDFFAIVNIFLDIFPITNTLLTAPDGGGVDEGEFREGFERLGVTFTDREFGWIIGYGLFFCNRQYCRVMHCSLTQQYNWFVFLFSLSFPSLTRSLQYLDGQSGGIRTS